MLFLVFYLRILWWLNYIIHIQVQNRITALTAINGELDDLTRRREAILQWSAELRSTVGELKQRKARLRPEAAQHDLTQVRHHSY